MKNRFLIFPAAIAVAAIGWVFYVTQTEPAEQSEPAENIPGAVNTTNMPLELPAGFSISVFAKNLPGARVMIFDQLGNMWISQTSKGVISQVEIKDGNFVAATPIFRNLKNPHGLAIDPDDPFTLFFAEENKISKVRIYSEDQPQKIIDLPGGRGHFTRTLLFDADKKLYVSIGSSCNVCDEKDSRRAKIFVMDKDSRNFREFARGLRNSVFMTLRPATGEIWATEMGRDFLGDNLPPDEINIIKDGQNYGWPICYGQNIHDTEFDKKTYIRNPCQEPFETPARIEVQAHSAPLGLAFMPENSSWPKDYWGDLMVAFHGSWNRSVPTGYKIVRVKLDDNNNYLGTEDFVSGWLAGNGKVFGRPVDISIRPDGTMYVSDDKAGVIYKITYK